MNNFSNNFIYVIFTAVFGLALVALPSSAMAQTSPPIEVDFQTSPLFNAGNFLPGDSISKTVTVTNQSETDRDVEVASAEVTDDDDLGDILDITIDIPGDSPYTNTLADFFNDGDVYLSTLSAGEKTTYTFTVEFEDTDDNSYQGKTLGFDLCVGFSGGQFSCSEVTDDNGDGGGDGNGDNEEDVGRGGGGPNTITSSSDDPDDDSDDDGDVAGVSTTTQPNLANLLDDLEEALRGLLGSLSTPTQPKVAGAQDSPGLPNTGDDGRSVQLIAVLLSLLATGLLAYRIIGRIYRRIRS